MANAQLLLFLLAAFVAGAEGRSTPAVARKVNIDQLATALVSLEKTEFGLIDQIFKLAQSELMQEMKRSVAAAPVAAAGPAVSPGAEGGNRVPATGPAYKVPDSLKAIKPEMKAAVLPKFTVLCAAKLQEMVNDMATYLAKNGASNSTIGHSMATHFQVTCEGAMPVKEQLCDDTSIQLSKLIESGKPIGAPAGPSGPAAFLQAKLPAGAPNAAYPADIKTPESGSAWCEVFFGMYFDAVAAAGK